jgi:aspartyl-tRNA(Asn)/glutamyl-tRNA(Gln) amidotransferase subunit C
MKISREDVLRVAELAHLELAGAEVETYRAQLDSILTYIEKLNELDTATVEPMAGGRPAGIAAPGENPALRDDAPGPAGKTIAEAVLQVAPDPAPPYFRVPKVIERE